MKQTNLSYEREIINNWAQIILKYRLVRLLIILWHTIIIDVCINSKTCKYKKYYNWIIIIINWIVGLIQLNKNNNKHIFKHLSWFEC